MTTAEQLIDRAHRLVPVLRSRASEAERMGRLHDETTQDFIDAEFLKAMVPRDHGGFELNWDTTSKLVQVISSGCGAAGWVLNAYLCTTWVAATFSPVTQREVFGDKGYIVGPCPMNPLLGRARRVDGGYRVTLKAPFGSGVYHSEWAVLCANVERTGNDESQDLPQALVMLLPRRDYRFDLSSWAVLGMRATGSATLVVEDVFVPDHRAFDYSLLDNGASPGAQANPASVYRAPIGPAFVVATASSLIGMVRNGVEALKDNLGSSKYALTGKQKKESVSAQIRLGEAAAHANAAAALLDSDAAIFVRGVEQQNLPVETRVAIRLHAAYCALLCRRSIDVVKEAVGANALRDDSLVQRIFRDIHMASGNFAFQLDAVAESYGRQQLGLPIDMNSM